MKRFFVIFLFTILSQSRLFAAEAGMPQLDPKYWASQAFWLVLIFAILYFAIANIFIPKIKNSLDDRNDKIKNDLDEAKNLQEISEEKLNEYNLTIEKAKKDVQKILFESKNKLKLDIQEKKNIFEKEIDKEVENTQKEINKLKQNSLNEIQNISKELASEIIIEISGDKLNESSIKAAIAETSKKELENYS
jgi:F-type H+-transporting ATPase subunit b